MIISVDKELIEEKFSGVNARLDSNNELMHLKLKEISNLLKLTHDQACKTNGRLNKLEIETIPSLNNKVRVISWFNDKPQRYLLFVAPYILSIKEVRDMIFHLIKLM